MSFTQELKFSELTKLLEAVSSTKLTKKRDDYVKNYFSQLDKFRIEFKKKNPDSVRTTNFSLIWFLILVFYLQESSSLPVLRLILSQEEKERSYGLQEKTLRQLYIKALKLHKNSADAVKIIQCSEEDLPSVIHEVMKTRTSEGNLTIYEVDDVLTQFSDNQKQSFQENELRRIILHSNALDQKWFCKMILKRMNLLIGTKKLLRLFHPKADELFLKYNHLSRVVELVESGQAEAAMIEVTQVFQPIRSMLCQKFTPTLNKDFMQKEMFRETKMDGERFQIHMKAGEFRYYSRNGHEFSEGFNELLTPLIQFSSVVHSIILDGEMLVYDKNVQRFFAKGDAPVDVKHMREKNSNLRPCFCAFDVLLYNDESYLNRPYSIRHQLLHELFKDREGVLVKTNPVRIRDIDHMVELFNIAMDDDEEGIILKDAESVYKPGDRAGGWYKVKPDYFDGEVVKEFDCIIIGGYYANPYKKDFIRRYVLGAIEKVDDGTINVYAVGEVVHGVKVQERMKIDESLKPHIVEHDGGSEVSFGGGKILFGRNRPHVWLPPSKSIVLECRVSELARSSEHYADYTFRFPRINAVRRDKIWDESCTMKEFLEMCQSDDGRVKKVVQRKVHAADITSPQRKRKFVQSSKSVIEQFTNNSQDLMEVEAVDNVMEGKEFCVLTTNPSLPSIKEMKKMVKKHGGVITEYPRKGKTFAIIAGLLTHNVKTAISSKSFNVIKADWLVNNFGGVKVFKEMPKIRPVADLYYATDALKDSLKDVFDDYGDSYNEAIEDVYQLKTLLGLMKDCNDDKRGLGELDDEMFSFGMDNVNFFRNVSGAFFTLRDEHFLLQSAKSVLKFRAGSVIELENFADGNLNVFVDKNEDIGRIKKAINKNRKISFAFVDFLWILDSNDAGKALEQRAYHIPEA